MVHFGSIFYLVGWLLLILSPFTAIPTLFDFLNDFSDYKAYLLSGIIMVFFGSLLVLLTRTENALEFNKRDAFLLTSLAWILVTLFAALPFMMSSLDFSYTNSLFEALSGLTTTGSTIIENLDQMPHGILIWRALLQWLGGVGIVVMALTVLTEMKIGGMELFQTESSEKGEKFLPRVTEMAKLILIVYCILTFLCMFFLYAFGMSSFDALCHSLTTVSTGGFSTHTQSIQFFNNTAIELTLSFFMFTGGITQSSFILLWQRKWKKFFTSPQTVSYFKLLISSFVAATLWRFFSASHEDPLEVIRQVIFNITSIVTTTGFFSQDYSKWGSFIAILVLILPFVGGATGSTSGGIKIFRFQILWQVLISQFEKLRRPYGVYIPKYNNRKISEGVFTSISIFFFLFIASTFGLALILSALGLDAFTAFSAASAMLTNIGIIISDTFGPTQSFASFSPSIKWALMLGMLLGRLELLTLYIMLMRSFWKD